jgi:anti-sigma B factor antagonist
VEAKFEYADPSAPSVSAFVIHLEGEFDLAERDRLTDAAAVAQNAPVVVINLERTGYIDSSVLHWLMTLHLATRKRGAKLTLVGARGTVRRLLEITQMDKVFDVRSKLSDLAGVNGHAQRLTIEARPIPET